MNIIYIHTQGEERREREREKERGGGHLYVHLAATAICRPLAGEGVVDPEPVGVRLQVRLRVDTMHIIIIIIRLYNFMLSV
jgi:hypothetical protein